MENGQKAAWSVTLVKQSTLVKGQPELRANYTIVASSDALMRAKLNELAGDSSTIESITRNVGVVVEADVADEV